MRKRFRERNYFDLVPYISNKLISRPARVLMIAWFLGGLMFILGGIFPELDVNPAIAQAKYTEIALGVLLMLGSSIMSCSVLNWKHESTAWQLELISLPILIAAWIMYTFLVILATPASLFPLVLGIAHVAYCGMRLYEVNKFIRTTRENVKQMEVNHHDS